MGSSLQGRSHEIWSLLFDVSRCRLEHELSLSGIDWHFWPTSEPWDTHQRSRPGLDAVEYNEYAWRQCQDLIQRHKPYFLWGDVSWPEA